MLHVLKGKKVEGKKKELRLKRGAYKWMDTIRLGQTKVGAFLLVLMFCCWLSSLCDQKEAREGPAWSRSHPLLIEHLSLLVMDVTKSCSCMDTEGSGGGGQEAGTEDDWNIKSKKK